MSTRPHAPVASPSIAVLPFVSMSADPENEYFSDGITEEIINALTRIQGLKVTARTSSFAFKNKAIDIRTIGNRLGVATVLEGSVRRSGAKVRITAQLIRTEDGFHIWSRNFDRELADIFALQDEISLLIADKIREHFGHFDIDETTRKAPTDNIDAYNLLLKGKYQLKRKDFDDIKAAMACFQEATTLDPFFAEAHASIAETYLHYTGFNLISQAEGFDAARNAAQKAISLDPTNPHGYRILAYVYLFYDWNWDAALRAYSEAVQLGLSDQNEFISYYYIFIQNDCDRAIQISRQLLKTDPLHVIRHWQLGMCYYFGARFEEAVRAFDQALELEHNFGEAHRWRGHVLGYLGRFDEALAAIDTALAITNGEGPAHQDRLIVQILMGERASVLPALKQQSFVDPMDAAQLYAILSMPDAAILWLERGFAERSAMLVTLKHFWLWDSIRDDARFQALVDRMGFPDHAPPTGLPIPLPAPSPQSATVLPSPDADRYLERLTTAMTSEQLHLDPLLSLRHVAQHIDLHPNKLSWLLNTHVGKNFNEFVNAYRLATFQEKALTPSYRNLTLLSIAYESGFNSKSVFNPYFKKMTGMTPRAWVKAQQS